MARHELEAERGRDRVDVPDPQGRQVPQRPDDDRRRRREDVQGAHRADVRGRVRLQGDPLPERRRQDRPVHGPVPSRPADGRLPVPRQPDDLPGADPPEELHARHVRGLEDARHRAVQVQELQPDAGGAVRAQHGLLGRGARARRRQALVLPGHRDPGARAARRPGRPRAAALGAGGHALPRQLEVPDVGREDLQPPRVRAPHRHRAVQRRPRPPRRRAHAQPPADHQDAVQRARDPRQRLAVLDGLPVARPVGAPADAEHRAREGAARRRGQAEPEVHDHDLQDTGDPGLRADHPVVRSPGRDAGQPRVPLGRRLLRRTGRDGLQHQHAVAEPPGRDHRLRAPCDPERVPRRAARDGRGVEPGALCEPDLRLGGEVVHRGARPSDPAEVREADRGDPAAGHPDRVRLLLQLRRCGHLEGEGLPARRPRSHRAPRCLARASGSAIAAGAPRGRRPLKP